MKISPIACSTLLFFGVAASQATDVDSELISLGGNQWRYNYSVENNTLGGPLTDLVVFFSDESTADAFNYTFDNVISPTGWSAALFPPSAPDLGGFVEWTGGSIPDGGTQGGFAVEFTYTGSESLSDQLFRVYDDSFNILDEGQTSPLGASVPDQSGTLTFALLALVSMAGFKRFEKQKSVA